MTPTEIERKICELEEILQAGETSTTIDGTTTTIDLNVIRQQLENLRQKSPTRRALKPRIASIYLGGQM